MSKAICGTKRQQKKVKDFMADMQWMFGVANYKVSVLFEEKPDGETAADVTISEAYQRITVCVYPLFFNSPEKLQRQYLIHEFCHFFIAPIQKVAENLIHGQLETTNHIGEAVEKSTSRCEKVILFLLEKERDWVIKDYQKYVTKKSSPKKKKLVKKRKK